MYLTMFAVMLAAVVGYTDCHLSNTEQTTKQISIDINAIPSKGTSCTEPLETELCLNGGRCRLVVVMNTYSMPYCECANGFMGERCEQKYLEHTYLLRKYMELDDSETPQNQSDVDEFHVGSGAVNLSVTVILLTMILLLWMLHHMIVAV